MNKFLNLIFVLLLIFLLESAVAQSIDSAYVVSYDEIAKIIDGDTFKFKKTEKSNRLLCIDTEETYKGKNALEKTNAIKDNWLDYYYQSKTGKNSTEPIKLDSPFGYETAMWAVDFFRDVNRVRIEFDDTLRTVDLYGRQLVYVFAEKNGKFINYNLECVRLGYSPYFNKYGNSNRFHSQFEEAQDYARQHMLGIWNPESKCYPDYDERIKWWNERAAQLNDFKSNYRGNSSFINILNLDAVKVLGENVGKEITVFGSLSEIFTDRFPNLLRMSISREISVDLYITEKDAGVLSDLDLEKMGAYFFYCKGKLEANGDKFKIKLSDKNQVKLF